MSNKKADSRRQLLAGDLAGRGAAKSPAATNKGSSRARASGKAKERVNAQSSGNRKAFKSLAKCPHCRGLEALLEERGERLALLQEQVRTTGSVLQTIGATLIKRGGG